jgi:tetratricopeptide (TPR) repeat protein
MILPSLFRSRGLVVGAVLYGVTSLLCTQIPLLNYLGFEFSVVTAVLASAVAGYTTISAVRIVYRGTASSPPGGSEETLRAWKAALWGNSALLVIPICVMLANAFVVRNCSLPLGLAFFGLIPAVTVLFSCCLGLFCTVHYAHPRSVYTFLAVCTVLYALGLGYWTPAIFSYNFFYGYFPGFTYDELLQLRLPLILFRLLTLVVAFLLFWMARLLLDSTSPEDGVRKKGFTLLRVMMSRQKAPLALGAAALLIAAYALRCELGFESTASYIQHVLGGSFRTDHVTIFYDTSAINREEIRWVAAEHEFLLGQVRASFVLPERGRIESFVYPSAETKQRLIGAGQTDIAKPWSGQVHVTRQSMDATLMHEMVHVVAGVFGMPVIRANLSPGLVEGLATAMQREWGTRSLHQYAAALAHAGMVPDMRDLMSVRGFASQSSQVSYMLAGSFCRYLIDRFGVRKIAQVYSTADYEVIYGRSLDELLAEWKNYVERLPGLPGDGAMVNTFFRRPPIFAKVCARVIAERNRRAREALLAQQYANAASLYAESFAEAGGYEALAGVVAGNIRLARFDTVLAYYRRVVCTAPRPTEYLPLFLGVGDALWGLGMRDSASSLYRQLVIADVSAGLTEGALLRLRAFEADRTAEALRSYLVMDAHDSVKVRLLDSLSTGDPGNSIIRYVFGKVLLRLGQYTRAVDVLKDEKMTDGYLEAHRKAMVGRALVRLGKFQEAKAEFWTALNSLQTDGFSNEMDLWIDRCDWLSLHGGPPTHQGEPPARDTSTP